MEYREAETLLQRTFDRVRDRHPPAGIEYIRAHWSRYVSLVREFPPLGRDSQVLEIGASILANVVRGEFGSDVTVLYHELEPEWPPRFEPEGIRCFPVELVRDPLPAPDGAFDFILCNEVVEHLPVAPEYLLAQIFAKLKPEGRLLFTVPNFATAAHRWALWRGKNPQDPMDRRFVYYAHHREPVMQECLDLVSAGGGKVLDYKWSDCEPPRSRPRVLWNILRYLKHLEFNKVLPILAPSLRKYIMITAVRDMGKKPVQTPPPLLETGEFVSRIGRKG